jgi:hypothetical protein
VLPHFHENKLDFNLFGITFSHETKVEAAATTTTIVIKNTSTRKGI